LRLHGAGDGVPASPSREFRRYLECGILAPRLCPRTAGADYGHDFLIAVFLQRAWRLSVLTTRRMVETAAYLAEHVIPQPASTAATAWTNRA